MPRKYGRPPLVEALCEFRFKPSQPWDWAIPGMLYDKIKEEFPVRQQQNMMTIQLHPMIPSMLPAQTIAKLQFHNSTRTRVVQVGPDVLTVNQLPPYPGWDEFLPAVLHQLSKYIEVAHPEAISAAVVRYLNKIEVPAAEFPLERYLRIGRALPPELDLAMLTMLQQYELDHTDPFGKLKYSISTQPSGQPDSTPIVLDLELQSPPLDLESAHTWVNRAHEAIERAFEASLTDTTRSDLFQEIPQ